MTRYTTRTEAIAREIVEPIEASVEVEDAATAYDLDAIADEVLGNHEDGYACQVPTDVFWGIVSDHEL